MKASTFLTEEQKKSVEAAVTEAERKTSGEIVVVLATKSGRYDRGEDLFGIVLGLTAVTAGWFLLGGITNGNGSWETTPPGLLPILGLFLGGFILGAVVATLVPQIGLLFCSQKMKLEEIRRQAAEAFFRFRVRKTAEGTGILIYVSLFERLVWVVGDDAINEKFDPAAWNDIRDRITSGFGKGDRAGGLSEGVRLCGEKLAEHFPIREGDVNEVSNAVRFID